MSNFSLYDTTVVAILFCLVPFLSCVVSYAILSCGNWEPGLLEYRCPYQVILIPYHIILILECDSKEYAKPVIGKPTKSVRNQGF